MARNTEKQMTLEQVEADMIRLVALKKTLLQESLQPLKDKVNALKKEYEAGLAKVREVEPEWEPDNLGSEIFAWLTEKETATKEQVQAQFEGRGVGQSLSGLIKNGRVTLTGDKYSVTITPTK